MDGARRGRDMLLKGLFGEPHGYSFLWALSMAFFILEDALSVRTNLGKHSLFVWLFVSSVKTGTRRIIRPDKLSSVVRLERCFIFKTWRRLLQSEVTVLMARGKILVSSLPRFNNCLICR